MGASLWDRMCRAFTLIELLVYSFALFTPRKRRIQ